MNMPDLQPQSPASSVSVEELFPDEDEDEELIQSQLQSLSLMLGVDEAEHEADASEQEPEPSFFDGELMDLDTDEPEDEPEGEAYSWGLPPSSTSSFPTLQEARKHCDLWAHQHGYEVVVGRTEPGKRQLKCGRSGKTKNTHKKTETNRIRKTSSHKSGCPFSFWLDEDEGTKYWHIRHTRAPHPHNHQPLQDGSMTANMRRNARTQALRTEIRELAFAGIDTRQIKAVLRQRHPQSGQTEKDINNIVYTIRQELRQDRSVTTTAIQRARAMGFFVQYEEEPIVDGPPRLQRLFLAHPKSITLYKQFSDVLVMDCTYKTNAYNWPLLNICGVTGSNKTIHIGFSLIETEAEGDFYWTMFQLDEMMRWYNIPSPKLVVIDRDEACIKAVKRAFPTIPIRVCTWHLHKDCVAYQRSRLGRIYDEETGEYVDTEQGVQWLDAFENALSATTEADMLVALEQCRTIWEDGYEYLRRNWFDKYAAYICAWSLDNQLHFGIAATSRVEGNHSTLKKWLRTSRNDILGFFLRLYPWWENTFETIQHDTAIEKERALLQLDVRFFRNVQREVYRFALREALKQYHLAVVEAKRIREARKQGRDEESLSLRPCRGVFEKQWGIRCQHTMRNMILQSRSLLPSDFHAHHQIRPDCQGYKGRPELDDPLPRPKRANTLAQKEIKRSRPKRSSGINSNQREDLWAEHIAGPTQSLTQGSSIPKRTQVPSLSMPKSRVKAGLPASQCQPTAFLPSHQQPQGSIQPMVYQYPALVTGQVPSLHLASAATTQRQQAMPTPQRQFGSPEQHMPSDSHGFARPNQHMPQFQHHFDVPEQLMPLVNRSFVGHEDWPGARSYTRACHRARTSSFETPSTLW